MSKMIINVTQKNINNGKPCSSGFCPIALALQDMGFTEVDVCYGSTSFKNESGMQLVETSPLMEDFFHKFDEGLKVEPFSFQLEI